MDKIQELYAKVNELNERIKRYDETHPSQTGTKGDLYTKEMIKRIICEGTFDISPRPKYEDSTPAHTISVNHALLSYDLIKGESPLVTLRPIATKFSIGELLWIYRDASNNLDELRDKYGVTWWDEWDIGNRTIGSVYGETVRRYNLFNNLIEGIKKDPDSRRHIMNMWQEDVFKEPHGLKPCAYQTNFNVVHGRDGIDYLDMNLYQRSSDFLTAGCINQVQYLTLLKLVARETNLIPRKFSWFIDNIQIYDRHLDNAITMYEREGIDCTPTIDIDDVALSDITPDNIHVNGYPRKLIKEKNPQLKFELGI